MIGNRFNKWVVLEKGNTKYNGKALFYVCQCDCGTVKEVRAQSLKNGTSSNCGCIRKEIVRKMGLSRRKEGSAKTRKFKQYQKEAKNRNFEWTLTFEQFLELCTKNCHYCNMVPANRHVNANATDTFVYQGIDRKDPLKGYTVENSFPCCYQCNMAKNNYLETEFLSWIAAVYKKNFD